jgi:hypothetical protein
MALIPVGLSAQKARCVFIAVDGVGFWMYAPKTRLFGEAKMLEAQKEALQRFEINLAYLSLKISEEHFEEIKKELVAESPELEKLEASEMQLEIEGHIKRLLRSFKINHRVLSPYAAQITELYTGNKIFSYQVSMAFAALKNRYVDECDIEKDPSNEKLGYISMVNVKAGKVSIGKSDLVESDLQNEFISESLISEIYLFASAEHAEIDYLAETVEPVDPETEEKKD